MSQSQEGEAGPLVIARQGHFHVGGRYAPDLEGAPMVGQMYVEFQIPHELRHAAPIVMVHGGQQTGTNWTGTPDGREGWAQYFLRRGHAVYVVDQVGRGRSAWNAQSHGALAPLRTAFAQARFVAPEREALWPQAALHDQWPGGGEPGEAAFDAFIATQAPSIADFARQQELNGEALIALCERIGPCVLVVHSQAGAFGWVAADRRPDLVCALVAVEPNGPPVHDVSFLGAPDWFADVGRTKVSGLCDIQLTWDPPLADGETLAFEREAAPRSPECATCWRQQEPARRLPNLARVPILMLTAQASYHAPYDHCTAAFLRQAGVTLEHVYLADRGLHGNGHMVMIERNSDAVAAIVADWLER
ncbi:MAG: alpha/beta-hydrolase [Hyphomicrobiales bacterium]|nr:alpha/beta-hydrolase [Hyphomicrobiales bacterium]